MNHVCHISTRHTVANGAKLPVRTGSSPDWRQSGDLPLSCHLASCHSLTCDSFIYDKLNRNMKFTRANYFLYHHVDVYTWNHDPVEVRYTHVRDTISHRKHIMQVYNMANNIL